MHTNWQFKMASRLRKIFLKQKLLKWMKKQFLLRQKQKSRQNLVVFRVEFRFLSSLRDVGRRLSNNANIWSNIQFWALLGRCPKVLDEGCSEYANIWSNIHPTTFGRAGTMFQGAGRRLFKWCQSLIQHSPNNFGPCWDDVARCWTQTVQNVPTSDPTFTQQFLTMLGWCCEVLDEGCSTSANIWIQHLLRFLGHVGTMLQDVGRRLSKGANIWSNIQQFWIMLGWCCKMLEEGFSEGANIWI